MMLTFRQFKLVLTTLIQFSLSLIAFQAVASEFERFAQHNNEAEAVINHDDWDEFLKKYVYRATNGVNFVDYETAKAESLPALNNYLETLSHLDVTKYHQSVQMAYWINLYNALTVRTVLDAYPVDSIKEIDGGFFNRGPWKDKRIKVMDIDLSLDDIEHEILRTYHKDPRIHYAVNCASIGCPDLADKAYRAESLDEQLTNSAIAFINHPRGVDVDQSELYLSSIFDWYAGDFGGNDDAIIGHLQLYAQPELKLKLDAVTSIADYDYDWQLNGR